MQSKTDKVLLDSFVATGDESAFAELVARYSPMVYRACRRLLGNDHDAEDATQAAFVVLARKAGSLRQEGRLNGWLHRVARLVALEALQKRTDRERHQTESALWQESLAADLSEADRETVLRQVDTALDSLSALAKGAMKAMYIAKVKMVAAVAAAVMVTGAAVPVGIAVAQAVGKDASVKTNTASVVDDAKAMCLRAQQQMKSGDFKAAIQTFETLLQTYPDAKTIRPEALYWLGDCYSRTKDPAAAKRVWEKLNSEFPESNWGKYARGRLTEY